MKRKFLSLIMSVGMIMNLFGSLSVLAENESVENVEIKKEILEIPKEVTSTDNVVDFEGNFEISSGYDSIEIIDDEEFEVFAASYSGTCGENLTWTLDDAGTLTISGTGDMTNWSSTSSVPWYSYRSGIVSVIVEDGVKNIGTGAFSFCKNLTSVDISDSVASIGGYVFYSCDSLTDIEIPDSVTYIGEHAFYDCDNLISIIMGDGVTNIGQSAFYSCDNLISIIMGDGVTNIGQSAFSYCGKLTSIEIPESVTSIGISAFSFCHLLQNITVSEKNSYYFSDGYGVLYNKKKTELIQYPIGNTRIYFEVPNTVISIEEEAFLYSCFLKDVKLGSAITDIKKMAFYGCKSLENIEIPESVTKIEESAFNGCTYLKKIYYKGTEVTWDKIILDKYNDALTSAEIIFSSISMPIPIEKEPTIIGRATYDEETRKVTIVVSCSGMTTVRGGQIEIPVDTTVFEVPVKADLVISDAFKEASHNYAKYSNKFKFSFAPRYKEFYVVASECEMFTVTFTLLDGAELPKEIVIEKAKITNILPNNSEVVYAQADGTLKVVNPTFGETATPTATPTPTELPTMTPTDEPTPEPTAVPTPEVFKIPSITQDVENPNKVTLNYNDTSKVDLVMVVNAGEEDYTYTNYDNLIAQGKAAEDTNGNKLNPYVGYEMMSTTDGYTTELGRAGYYFFRITYYNEENIKKNAIIKIYVPESKAPMFIQNAANTNEAILNYNGASKVEYIYYINAGDEAYDYTTWNEFVERGISVIDKYGTRYNPSCGYSIAKNFKDGLKEIFPRAGHYTVIIKYLDTLNNSHKIVQKIRTDKCAVPEVSVDNGIIKLSYNQASKVKSVYVMNTGEEKAHIYSSWANYVLAGKAALMKDGRNKLNPCCGYDYMRLNDMGVVDDSKTYATENEGYHTVIIQYEYTNGVSERVSQNVYVEDAVLDPEIKLSGNNMTYVNNNAEEVSYVIYTNLGQNADNFTYQSYDSFIEYGKVAKDENGNKLNPSVGYRSVSSPIDGKTVTLPKSGTYATLIKYKDATGLSRIKCQIFTVAK